MTCPICHEQTQKDWRPFCSRRCADIDLGRWMTGSYRVETTETPSSESSGDHELPIKH